MERTVVQLGNGTDDALEYVDTGGDGPVVVFLHGVLMDESLWASTVQATPSTWRCLIPVLPLGAHRRRALVDEPGVRGLASLVAKFLVALDLHEVFLVGNDTGGAIAQALITTRPERVGAVALVSCDAFENFPPGLPGKTMALAARLPGMLTLAVASLRWRLLRRLPVTFGQMTRDRGSGQIIDRWVRAYLAEPAARRDLRRFLCELDRNELLNVSRDLGGFDRPALIVWASEDRVMPPEHAERLAALLPDVELAWVADSKTLVPLDQPAHLAQLLTDFGRARCGETSRGVPDSVTESTVVEHSTTDGHDPHRMGPVHAPRTGSSASP